MHGDRSPFTRVLLVFSILLNVFFAYQFFADSRKEETVGDPREYPLLSPRIFAEYQNDILIHFLPLRKTLRDMTSQYGDEFGMYFEYLPSGTSIGIHEKDEFYAASLIKVPVVMAYYRQAEATGLSLDDDVIHLEERDIDPAYGSLWRRGQGATITFSEAVRLALVESDNTAVLALANRVPQTYFDDVYEGLDIDFKKADGRVTISAKQYASILKALYFSAVLPKTSSQHILDLLTKTNFNDKLSAGVPQGVMVAHKSGVIEEAGVYQDCGIVYVPKRPYALCMMSKSSEDVARLRMSAVSRTVYEYVSGVNR